MEQKTIALDTEFERKHTYRPILSIIQIREDQKDPVIYDVLGKKNEELVSLLELLTDGSVVKIIHASKQDIEAIYYRFRGLAIKNVFDTQIAHEILTGEKEIGYKNVVKAYCGVDIAKEKKLQNSDWLKRPLTCEQIFYAKQDVLFLTEIYSKMSALLKKDILKNQQFVEQMEKITDEDNYRYKPNKYWLKFKDHIRCGNKSQYLVLKNLFILREKLAFRLNLPRDFVIKNDDLVNFAKDGDEKYLKVHRKVDRKEFVKCYAKFSCFL